MTPHGVSRYWKVLAVLVLITNELKHYLSKRGYFDQLLDSETNLAATTPNGSSFLCSNWKNSNRIPLVVTYHPNLPKLKQTIRHYHHARQDWDRLWKAFPFLSIIAFQWPRNPYHLLVHANMTPKISDPPGNFSYEARMFRTRAILVTTNTISSNEPGERLKLKLHASCKLFNKIYLIQCRRCDLQYEAETWQPLHSRINNHHFSITHTHKDKSLVVAHFTSEGHIEANFSVMIIDKCWNNDAIFKKIREIRWIKTFKTSWPLGMN